MRWPGFLLFPLLFVACTDTQPVAPIEDGPVFNWMNNPDNGNFNIYRDAFGWRVCWSDEQQADGTAEGNGLRVCHDTYPHPTIPQTTCDIQTEGDPVSHQDVGHWIDEFSSFLHAVNQGKTWVLIRDINTAGDCFGDALVAEGWGRLSNNDNDIFGSTDPNMNTWTNRGHGVLEATDGSRVMYNGHVHFQFRANGEGDEDDFFRVLSAKVNVH
ncbi:MAG: hypothetical protein OEO20_15330 [Gemmatimonadota bacterium]|nr:hypothetical protein [Gemmatimonadota bacterium]MDH3367408.1 hypothetical protein [Gemmatimonadota bacterium]MDH3479667.1 hypothetical protein [Gemmatimonadota bacterium]MDH3570734.1 hypothetical protein [Gemmatimonadota bacterium]MDH5550360.1 hypothetical protein [Gemmatimonadota bacterium]